MPLPRPHVLPLRQLGPDVDHLHVGGIDHCALPDWVHAPFNEPGTARPEYGSNDPALLTINEAAAYLRVSPRTLQRQVKDGQLPVVRIGRSVRIERVELEHLLRPKTSFFNGLINANRE